eukprot:3796964-Pleurochrysis_carterae.AAC.1
MRTAALIALSLLSCGVSAALISRPAAHRSLTRSFRSPNVAAGLCGTQHQLQEQRMNATVRTVGVKMQDDGRGSEQQRKDKESLYKADIGAHVLDNHSNSWRAHCVSVFRGCESVNEPHEYQHFGHAALLSNSCPLEVPGDKVRTIWNGIHSHGVAPLPKLASLDCSAR